nr:MAG TPA: glutaredoxin-like domain protein [Caudoviricetes sp.]
MQIKYTFALSFCPPCAKNRQDSRGINNELALICCLRLSNSSIRPPSCRLGIPFHPLFVLV